MQEINYIFLIYTDIYFAAEFYDGGIAQMLAQASRGKGEL